MALVTWEKLEWIADERTTSKITENAQSNYKVDKILGGEREAKEGTSTFHNLRSMDFRTH